MPPLQARGLGPAPVDYQGREVELALQPTGERALTISPYPFRENPLRVSVESRWIPKQTYSSDIEFRETLAGAECRSLSFELRG
jgi:hypothetical protein